MPAGSEIGEPVISGLPWCKSGRKCTLPDQHEGPCRPHPDAKPEAVNHPNHYGGDTTYEAIKVIEAWQLDFSLGNAVKYISRAGKKDPTKTVEDLKKAAWYLNRAIENASK